MLPTTPAILTCAVSGEGPIHPDFPDFPITPERIAGEVVAAAKAGASMVHCHVRDPETGKGSHDPALYKELSD
ncbi:MAG: 3-keto-5-aminohexanoate cleavage protein, partial [Pseudomonadota bacterium]